MPQVELTDRFVASAKPEAGQRQTDFYDAKTKQLIWRGSAQDTLSDKAAQNEKNLDKGVAKMFKAFPPNSAKS